MFAHAFVRDAYLAGTFVALACGCVGWFVVLRGQLFAGDALSHVAFVGAIAAAVLGVDERVGLFALTLLVAGAIAVLGRRGEPDDAVIGTVFAWILGIGILLITILATSSAGATGITTANTLFGFVYSLSAGQAWTAAGIGLAATVVIAVAVRPLLLSTLDPEVATVRGLHVKLLGVGVLAALAVVTAEGTQVVGALLVLGLLAAPAGAAHALTVHPYKGLALSYAIGSVPASSAIIGIAAAMYAAARAWSWLRAHPRVAQSY
jgi:zinc/manganese transport system permease protein